jgi:hypothetical protein
MGFIESLKSGSVFHKVDTFPDGSFRIRVADRISDECREEFHRLVNVALGEAEHEGYKAVPHRSAADLRGRWDSAVFTRPESKPRGEPNAA